MAQITRLAGATMDELRKISALLQEQGAGTLTPELSGYDAAAQSWLDADFIDAEEVAGWLAAGCLTAQAAQDLEDAGFTPAQASLMTLEGNNPAADTIGAKVTRGELTHATARRIVTNAFWNE